MFLTSGKTYRQLATQLRQTAAADRRAFTRRKNEFTLRSAIQLEAMATLFDELLEQRGNLRATDYDIDAVKRRLRPEAE